ncbi:MAG TPA: hypothetical protein PK993_05450 [Clostridia bacterium]|nr:hypothetical protein [Clostridia bacterium]
MLYPSCRGFECIYLKGSGNECKRFIDCKRPDKQQALTGREFKKCSACDILNNCEVCEHFSTCQDAHKKDE